jgi:hypothetical protein
MFLSQRLRVSLRMTDAAKRMNMQSLNKDNVSLGHEDTKTRISSSLFGWMRIGSQLIDTSS